MKKVIYDQDGLGLRDHNLYGLLGLLQAPGVELVGLTTVSGREWSPRQVPRALRYLELLGRPEIPVAGGAVFPLLNSPARSAAWESLHGPLFDTLCHELHELDEPTDADPFWVPAENAMDEIRSGGGTGIPACVGIRSPARSRTAQAGMPVPPEPAAVFMTRMARQYPGELAIVATGPLTNLALACRLDPAFPQLIREVIFVGGRFMPHSLTGRFTRTPSRREPNLRHDPEAAHIVLQADWTKLTCLPRDLTDPIRVTAPMHAAVARARTPVGRFLKDLKHELCAKGDALAAAVCAEPGLIADSDSVCLDVDLNPHGANYGCLLNWRDPAFAPATNQRPIHVITAIHEKAFAQNFVKWCTAKTTKPKSFNAETRRRGGRKARTAA